MALGLPGLKMFGLKMDCGLAAENATSARCRSARDQVSFAPIRAWWASRIVTIRVMGSSGDG